MLQMTWPRRMPSKWPLVAGHQTVECSRPKICPLQMMWLHRMLLNCPLVAGHQAVGCRRPRSACCRCCGRTECCRGGQRQQGARRCRAAGQNPHVADVVAAKIAIVRSASGWALGGGMSSGAGHQLEPQVATNQHKTAAMRKEAGCQLEPQVATHQRETAAMSEEAGCQLEPQVVIHQRKTAAMSEEAECQLEPQMATHQRNMAAMSKEDQGEGDEGLGYEMNLADSQLRQAEVTGC